MPFAPVQLFLITIFLLFSQPAFAAEVLMVKWMQKAETDKAFEQHLRKLRPDVKIRVIQANRNVNNLVRSLKNYDFSKVDLVYSFGTTGTKIVKAYLKGKKPQIFNLVSTPVLSNIADSLEKPGNNLTGAKMLVDLELQIELLRRLKPIRKLMVWFDPREKQNNTIRKRLLEITKKRNISLKLVRIIPDAKNFNHVLKEASKAALQYDVLFMIASASFYRVDRKLHSMLPDTLLVMGTMKDNVRHGSTLAITSDLRERSRTVAEMANMILDGAKAQHIPVNTVTGNKVVLYINKNKIHKVGLKDLKTLGLKIEQYPGDIVIYPGSGN